MGSRIRVVNLSKTNGKRAMRQIEFEPHALDQMKKRGVDLEAVELTVREPEHKRPARRRREPCTIHLRRIGTRTCKVYVRDGSDPPLVATVAWHGE